MKKPLEYIYNLRNDYASGSLDEANASENPFDQFEKWLAEAIVSAKGTDEDVNAMMLSTADLSGRVSSRIVLLRGFSPKGFVFFTNYGSRKGAQIAENPQGSLLFFWAKLQRQVRVEGVISKTSRRVSAEYFSTRPRESQIGAWASAQSSVIESRRELEERIAALEKKFEGKPVPCPPFWGGYVLKPDFFEFWQGRASRLHDRLRYTKRRAGWKIERLSP
jgi:pyridoxamine-phosphate oxidase